MTFIFSPLDDVAILYAAGFRVGKGLTNAIAVSCAESHYNPAAQNTAGNSPPSTDRGLRQINSYWHPEVTDACAYDPVCSAKEMFRISKQGTDFAPWATFNNGAYKPWVDWAFVAVDAYQRLALRDNQIAVLTASVASRDATIANLQKQLDASKQATSAASSRADALQAQLTALTTSDTSLAAELQAATTAMNEANIRADTLDGQLTAQRQRVDDWLASLRSQLEG